jgi:hypothetical protein
VILRAASAGAGRRRRPSRGADGLTVGIQALIYGAWLWAAVWEEVIYALDAVFVAALRSLGAAVVVEADVTRLAAILVEIYKVDAFAVGGPSSTSSPACAAGSACAASAARRARRGGPWLMHARCKEKARRREENQAEQKRSHGFLEASHGRQQSVAGWILVAAPLASPPLG